MSIGFAGAGIGMPQVSLLAVRMRTARGWNRWMAACRCAREHWPSSRTKPNPACRVHGGLQVVKMAMGIFSRMLARFRCFCIMDSKACFDAFEWWIHRITSWDGPREILGRAINTPGQQFRLGCTKKITIRLLRKKSITTVTISKKGKSYFACVMGRI